jgi:hypothetical protein
MMPATLRRRLERLEAAPPRHRDLLDMTDAELMELITGSALDDLTDAELEDLAAELRLERA